MAENTALAIQKLYRLNIKIALMDRVILPHELDDPDVRWLLSNYRHIDRSMIIIVDESKPVSLIVFSDEEIERLKNITQNKP